MAKSTLSNALACSRLLLAAVEAGSRLIHPRLIYPGINLQQQIAGIYVLIVPDEQAHHLPGHLGRDGRRIAFDEGIVSGFKRRDESQVVNSHCDKRRHCGNADDNFHTAPMFFWRTRWSWPLVPAAWRDPPIPRTVDIWRRSGISLPQTQRIILIFQCGTSS